jgi:two-component system NtrC family sensor kinase
LLSPEGRVLHANKTEREKLGFTLEELQGMALADRVPPGEWTKLARHQREVARRGRSRVETVFLPRTGDPIEVEMGATGQFDERGQLVQVRAFVRDVTERKRLEQTLLQTEKMVAVGQLSSGIAHEIGTPLNAISGTAEYLLMSGTGNGREELQSIVAQARRISHLVQQLLDFSRRDRPRRLKTDVHELLRATLHLLERPLAAAGVRVDLRLAPPPVLLSADPHQLQQVFINIILNAEQAMPAGGALCIQTRRNGRAGRRLEVVFEDAGPGIPEPNLGRIFEPFFTTKEVGKGTGLGLAICDSILRAHRGGIRAENAPGGGARFLVTLPLLPQEV